MARPLRALWLTNSSSLVLDGGSFNVLEGGAFAGEGLIEAIHPGERRLISYAADLAMQVVMKSEGAPEKLIHIRIARGLMFRTVQSHSKTIYTIHNEDGLPRTVIIEQPIRQGWKLAAGLKAEEETATAYRFRVEMKAKETKDFVVEETTPTTTDIKITNMSDSLITAYTARHEFTPELERALRGILAQKDAIAKLDAEIKEKQVELEGIATDQNRVRENLRALKGTAEEKALAQRYVKELDEQETRLATLKKEILGLQAKRKQAQQDLDDTIEHFTFDGKMDEGKEM
jgi:predicted component of type VI protein secretion system